MRTAFFLFLLILRGGSTHAQGVNLGNPPVTNFPKAVFQAGTQTWDISQDDRGVMWFGNNDGLLEFDGAHWRLYPLDNGTIVRSVQAGRDGRIYVGGQGDFGYFAPDERGKMAYRSLGMRLAQADRHFGDVWDVQVCDEGVFFRTDRQVFRYYNGQLSALFPKGISLMFMGLWGKNMVVQDSASFFHVFENGQLRRLGSPEAFRGGKISAVLPLNADTVLVTTIQDGIFFYTKGAFQPWVTQNDAFLKTYRIFCAALLPNGKIALGTSLNGFVTLDRQRRIFHHLNKKSGLQNNTVLSLFATRYGGVWLGLDNGIDFVELQSAFTSFFPDGDLQGTGYTMQVFGDKIYFGANTGLYATDWKPYYTPEERYRFVQVRQSEGQVWSLNELGGQLLMGHHEGAFVIEGLQARPLARLQGIWRFVSWTPDFAIAGHYNGLAGFRKTVAGWVFESRFEGLAESSRMLAKDQQGNLWMAHPYRGVYRIRVHPEQKTVQAEFFGAARGLPSDVGNHLFQLGDDIVFTGKTGLYEFDPAQGRFRPNVNFNRIFGEKTGMKYLRKDSGGNIWYVTDTETGMLQVETGALEKKVRRIPIPELNGKLTGGFPFILPVDAHNVFFATGQGFIHFDPAAYTSADTAVRLVLHEVRLKAEPDSLLFGGHGPWPGAGAIVLPNKQNTLAFRFSAPDYPGGGLLCYAHYLQGASQKWSEWSTKPDVLFSHLPPGKYVFHVKARNQYGVESRVLSFPFEILPPWYASRAAYLFYGLLLLGAVIAIIRRQQNRFEQEKQQLQTLHQRREEQHQLLARQSEEAINRLQNEKLEAEVHHKTQELASATMHLVQKNEILNSIRQALEKLKNKGAAQPGWDKEIARIIKMMDHDAMLDADWEHFSANFDQVHSDFLKRLGEQYEHLSPNDYKLCAYLRMNLSSKEIASLMSISVRGVEASRYRLRKRLGLDTETNLTEFLMRF